MLTTQQQKENTAPIVKFLDDLGAAGTARVLDRVMLVYSMHFLNRTDETPDKDAAENLYHLRELRDTMLEVAGCPLGGADEPEA